MGMLFKRVFDLIQQIKISNATRIIKPFDDAMITKQDNTKYEIFKEDTGGLCIGHESTFVIDLNEIKLKEYLGKNFGNYKLEEWINIENFSKGGIIFDLPNTSDDAKPSYRIQKGDFESIYNYSRITIAFDSRDDVDNKWFKVGLTYKIYFEFEMKNLRSTRSSSRQKKMLIIAAEDKFE